MQVAVWTEDAAVDRWPASCSPPPVPSPSLHSMLWRSLHIHSKFKPSLPGALLPTTQMPMCCPSRLRYNRSTSSPPVPGPNLHGHLLVDDSRIQLVVRLADGHLHGGGQMGALSWSVSTLPTQKVAEHDTSLVCGSEGACRGQGWQDKRCFESSQLGKHPVCGARRCACCVPPQHVRPTAASAGNRKPPASAPRSWR